MSRLPVVGQDNDVWGGVLNDFLSQSLNSDGSLKNSSVASNLPDASTTTKGIVKLVGDLGGTATSPTVPGLAAREQTVNKDQINGYAGLDGNGLLKTAELPSSVVTNNQTQSAENTVLPLFTINPKTSGFEPFQVQMNSYVNPGGGAGTYNHAMFLGWNASTHGTGTPAVSGKPSLIMGMEDNYYDSGGTNLFGMEWYVEYFSPDGTSVQGLRPFYARISSDTNARNGCIITFDIGTDG
ncbi:MAG TPA: hypothetical protein VLF63_03060, partial [Patescibacteria group bacterium]|nr:hypothetical protein [Patescibacteria group bacterium]